MSLPVSTSGTVRICGLDRTDSFPRPDGAACARSARAAVAALAAAACRRNSPWRNFRLASSTLPSASPSPSPSCGRPALRLTTSSVFRRLPYSPRPSGFLVIKTRARGDRRPTSLLPPPPGSGGRECRTWPCTTVPSGRRWLNEWHDGMSPPADAAADAEKLLAWPAACLPSRPASEYAGPRYASCLVRRLLLSPSSPSRCTSPPIARRSSAFVPSSYFGKAKRATFTAPVAAGPSPSSSPNSPASVCGGRTERTSRPVPSEGGYTSRIRDDDRDGWGTSRRASYRGGGFVGPPAGGAVAACCGCGCGGAAGCCCGGAAGC
mmetsp:Transcript_11368/g.25886  ORF Transcript_11368/g.25886 Transcript_11368/m.25886 type:complete len:321 (-) Transcript_11368:389-1351(-)